MGQYDDSGLNDWSSDASYPAAPAGMQQAARAASGFQTGDPRYSGSQLGRWTSENGYAGTTSSWFTGQNREGTNNGWDTAWQKKFQQGQKDAAKAGNLAHYFDQEDANGVVLWDHTSKDGSKDYKFGDVFEDGRLVSNVYDQFDQRTADMMMSVYVLKGDEQARVFGASDSKERLHGEIMEKKDWNNENIPKQFSSAAFQKQVARTAAEFDSAGVDTALIATSAAASAGIGAGIASFIPGVGTAVGGLIGGGIGGLGAYLNKDELTAKAARAFEITQLSFEGNNPVAGAGTALREFSGVAMELSSPFTNLTHGAAEVLTDAGDIGDHKSAYYATDSKGHSQVSGLWKVGSLGAAVADGVVQWTSPVGRVIYTAEMAGTVVGGVSELAASGGRQFNPRSGTFDNVFTDNDGNFDPISGAAGILNIAVDAVQIGGIRGLARATDEVAGVVRAGGQVDRAAGHRFTLDASGNVVGGWAGVQKTTALLAPSEQVAWGTAAHRARVSALSRGETATADDFYRASMSLSNSNNRLKTAMVNAFGEGYEEVWQSVLEPISQDGKLSGSEIMSSFFYGAAGGLGMSLGATSGAASTQDRMFSQAATVHAIKFDGAVLERETFDQWTPTEQRIKATMSKQDAQLTLDALTKWGKEQAYTRVASEIDAAKAMDAQRSMIDKDRNNATKNSDSYTVFSGQVSAGRVDPKTGWALAGTVRAEAIEGSVQKVFRTLEEKFAGLQIQQEAMAERVAQLEASEQTADVVARLAKEKDKQASILLQLKVGAPILTDVESRTREIYDQTPDPAAARGLTMELNKLLERAFDGDMPITIDGLTAEQINRGAQRFITLQKSREPKLDKGSYLAVLPQASWDLTRTQSNNFWQVNMDILQAIGGDFDGDKFRDENQLVLEEEEFIQMRSGQNFGGVGVTIDIATRNFEAALVTALGTGLVDTGAMKKAADASIKAIESAFTKRYGKTMPMADLQGILGQFRTAVEGHNPDARINLLSAMAARAGQQINNIGRSDLNHEWLWMGKVVNSNLQAFQRTFRMLRQVEASAPSEVGEVSDELTPQGINLRKTRATTDAQTLSLFAVGNSLFRKFQKIHYSFYNARVLRAAGVEASDLYEMARFYAELGKGVTVSELTRVQTDDTVAARVLVMLGRLVDDALADPDIGKKFSPSTAMSVFANMRVQDVWWEGGQPVTDGQNLSLAQLLLKRALEQERIEHKRSFMHDPEMQARHKFLEGMTFPNSDGVVNAERAYIEIFKAVPYQDSLGGITGNLAPQTTPQDTLKQYVSLDDHGQKQMMHGFTDIPEYLNRKESSNIPYTMDEAKRGEITPYRSMIDALLAVGNTELTFNPKTSMDKAADAFGGRLADTSKRGETDFVEGFKLVKDSLATYRKVTSEGRKLRPMNADLAQEMFAAYPEFGRQAIELLPDSAANAAFLDNGELLTSDWLYEMYAFEKPGEALMFYWRNLTLARWNATLSMIREDEGASTTGRVYNKLTSRFQRLLYELAQEPGQRGMELLLREITTATDLDQFFLWLNRTPGIKPPSRAPLLPFNDDVATFENEASTGWNNIAESGDLRAAISAMRTSAEQLKGKLDYRAEKQATDSAYLSSILRARNKVKHALPEDYENLRKFTKVVAISTSLPRGFAPAARMALARGVSRGFDSSSHEKGNTSTSFEGLGETQALTDAFGFLPELERTLDELTAHNISSLKNNVTDMARTFGSAMTPDGRQIQWSPMTVDNALELLSSHKTEQLAHVLLTPAALDVSNGKVVERLHYESSLTDLMEGTGFKNLFASDTDGTPSLNQDAQYLMTIDSAARQHGGNFDALRMVNALTVALTSSLGREATEDDHAKAAEDAHHMVATVLRLKGQIQSSRVAREAGMLDELREYAVETMRQTAAALKLSGFTNDQGQIEFEWLDMVLEEIEFDRDLKKETLLDQYQGQELTDMTAAVNLQYDMVVDRIKGSLNADTTMGAVSKFQLTGDPRIDVGVKAQIRTYVRSMASFGTRAPEAASAFANLMAQPKDYQPTAEEWDLLSRGAIGVYMVDQVLAVSSHISIPPFPQTDPRTGAARLAKYFDISFSWIADGLLKDNDPLEAGAVWLHEMAELPRGPIKIRAAKSKLERTILNPKNFGPWTPGILSQMVEAEDLVDSSGGPWAIAMPGNGPKRQAAISFATRRTDKSTELDTMLTTVQFTGDLLAEEADPFNYIPVTVTGAAAPTSMPVAELNNRFYSSLTVNGEAVPLYYGNMGYTWDQATEPTPLRYISVSRMRTALTKWASDRKLQLEDLNIEAQFLHMDSQPAAPEWFNNAYFEGMSHTMLPDGSASLIATLHADNGSETSRATQYAIDSRKKALMAIVQHKHLPLPVRTAGEELWATDFAGMLNKKTVIMMGHDLGEGPVAIEFYNAIHKTLKLQHIVAGMKDGKPAAMTAEEVIAHQLTSPDVPLPLENPRLVKLSSDVLRTMLGETGNQGVPRFFNDEYLLNQDEVDAYTGITPQMLERFGAGWVQETGTIADTSLTNIGQQRVLKINTMMSPKERSQREERIVFLDNRMADVQAARNRADGRRSVSEIQTRKDQFKVLFDDAAYSIGTERNTFGFAAQGLPIAPRNMEATAHSERAMMKLKSQHPDITFERAWRMRDEGPPNYVSGVLTIESLNEKHQLEDEVVKNDYVLVELNTFEVPGRKIDVVEQRSQTALRLLANTGTNIILGPGNAKGDLRHDSGKYLESIGYAQVGGSRHLYGPVEFVSQTQNERAYESTYLETQLISPLNNSVLFVAEDPIGTDEGVLIANPESLKLRDRAVLNNMLPSSMYPGYNMPIEDNADYGLYSKTLDHLRTITDPNSEHRAALLAMGGKDPQRVLSLSDALNDFHTKIINRSSLAIEPGDEIRPGDIVPFVHVDGKIIFYRRGLKPPDPDDLSKLQAIEGMNIAIAKSAADTYMTTNTGTVTRVDYRAGFGRRITLETPLQFIGNKIQWIWSGVKHTVVPAPEDMVRPTVALFRNGVVVDGWTDQASMDSKEGTHGRVNNYRNALAFYQNNFIEDMVRFFYPNKNPLDSTAQLLTYNLLHRLANNDSLRIPLSDAAILSKANVAIAEILADAAEFEAQKDDGPGVDWLDRLRTPEAASDGIAAAVITYLLSPNSHIDNVLYSAGFSHPLANTATATTREMPGLFADLLDHGQESAIHTELIRRWDAQLNLGPDGSGYKLLPNFKVIEFGPKKGQKQSKTIGYLQYGEAIASGDNPVMDGEAFDLEASRAVSDHNAMAAGMAVGAVTAFKKNAFAKSKAFARSFAPDEGVAKLGEGADNLWEMLTRLPDKDDGARKPFRALTGPEVGRQLAAREEIIGLYKELNREDVDQVLLDSYEREAVHTLNVLGLSGHPIALFDTWVRQHLGRPYQLDDQGNDLSRIQFKHALEIAKEIRNNVDKGFYPVAGANIPVFDINQMTSVFMANMNKENGWAPRVSPDPSDNTRANSWDGWVETVFGTAFDPNPLFDSVYTLAVDGLMHGYQGATSSTRYFPVSSEILRAHQLMDPETDRMFVSVSADENVMATDPTLFNSSRATLNDIMIGERIYDNRRGVPDPSSAKGHQRKRLQRWRKEVDANEPVKKKMRGIRSGGQTFIGHSTKNTAFWRTLINVRAFNGMFNIPLVVSAPIESFFNRTINTSANAITGEGTGFLAGRFAWASDKFADTSIGKVAEFYGVQPTWNADEHARIKNLKAALGKDKDFKSMVYKELTYQYPIAGGGINRFERGTEKLARFAARMSDPSYGMLPRDLVTIYIDTVLRRIAQDPTGENIYSVDTFIRGLSAKSDWVEKQDHEAHNMAIAAVANVRSLKPNILSMIFRGALEPASQNPRFLINSSGNLLRVMTLFQNFWSGFAIRMTGMQAPADFAAMLIDAREKKIGRRIQAVLGGQEFDDTNNDNYDMTEVLESMDLADAFIRGGVTHTALFLFGMASGGLGLSGEDDEEKWMRRQAEIQGAAYVQDPAQIQQDFANKGSLYLNWLPTNIGAFFRVPANNEKGYEQIAQMNMIARTFLSPVMGMERFFNTGDFMEVVHGFKDALGAHPIVNEQLWNAWGDTVAELHSQAVAEAEVGGPENMATSAHLLTTAVGILDRMLLENAMVNMVYIGADRYDRDPYKLPKLDSDMNQQGDVRGEPYGTTDALREYVEKDENGKIKLDEDGNPIIKEGYVPRDFAGAQVRTLTESRFGLAFLGSLWSGVTGGGFNTDLFRGNMPIKTREVELAPLSREEIDANFIAAFMGEGGAVGLTELEAADVIKKQYRDAGVYYDPAEVEKQAKILSAKSGAAAMSIFNAAGREVPTDEGAQALFRGLWHGTVKLGDNSLNGTFVSYDQRLKIQEDWMKKLVAEGVSMGLDTAKATSRMKRIWFGPYGDSEALGLFDIVFSKEIPFSDTLKYNQLNTTYVTGPDGYPRATGFTRGGLMAALGVSLVNRPWVSTDTGLDMDSRMNTVDIPAGINTGMRALERRSDSWEIPTPEEEVRAAAEKLADEIGKLNFSSLEPFIKNSGGSGGGFGFRGGGGGGGGYRSSGYSNFTKMMPFPNQRAPYSTNIPFINTSNPIIRRADVRRERVWSERGRLKQWQ